MLKTLITRVIACGLVALLSACGHSSPGPLAGTWTHPKSLLTLSPTTITFRDGEMEAGGTIEKVNYTVSGQSVIVTYESGLMRGSAERCIFLSPTTMEIPGTDTIYTRIGN